MRARVLADYTPSEQDGRCIACRAGEVVTVLRKGRDTGWWKCKTKQGVKGYLPASFLQEEEQQQQQINLPGDVNAGGRSSPVSVGGHDHASTLLALFSFAPEAEGYVGCLAFEKGDKLQLVERTADEWWTARKAEDVGLVPSRFVRVLNLTPMKVT